MSGCVCAWVSCGKGPEDLGIILDLVGTFTAFLWAVRNYEEMAAEGLSQ